MSEERKPVSNIAPFGLRLQPHLKTRLEAASSANGRSLNSEISARLEASFSEGNRIGDLTTQDLLRLLFGIDLVEQATRSLHEDEDQRDRLRAAGAYEAAAMLGESRRRVKAAIWASEFDASPELQREFGTREGYAAYMLHAQPDVLGAKWQIEQRKEVLADVVRRASELSED